MAVAPFRHCEERSDEVIQHGEAWIASLALAMTTLSLSQPPKKKGAEAPFSQRLPLVPVMPAVATAPVPVPAITAPSVRVITFTVGMAMPAIAPFVADVTGRYND